MAVNLQFIWELYFEERSVGDASFASDGLSEPFEQCPSSASFIDVEL